MNVVTDKKTPNTEPMPQAVKGIDADDLRGFIGWSTRFRIGPDDPLWGAVLATRISYQAATVSMGAATDLSAQVAKIPDIIFQGGGSSGGTDSGIARKSHPFPFC